jgi:hypothetical protein
MKTDYEPVGVREFREKLATYSEPVTVINTRGGIKVLGTWVPAGWEVFQVYEQSPNMGGSELREGGGKVMDG